MEVQWLEVMTQTATYQNVNSLDVYGKRTLGSTVTFHCHISKKRREVFNAEGIKVITSASVYMDGVYDVQAGAKVVLPDGSTPPIVDVMVSYDEHGAHHTTLHLG
jgi:hypothetical protein